eukprot:jgi/Chlat1/1716/Chrsp127S01939
MGLLLLRRGGRALATAASKAGGGAAASGKGKGKGKGRSPEDAALALLLKALTPAPKYTPAQPHREEDARKAKEYSRLKMAEQRSRNRDESVKLRLKREALAALPTDSLRMAALSLDVSPFPLRRHPATWTPPIPGFAERSNELSEEEAAKLKRR